MPLPPADARAFPARLVAWARAEGFADAAITPAVPLTPDLDHLKAWLAAGHHAHMRWLEDHRELRENPALLRPGTVTVISARMDCRPPAAEAQRVLDDPSLGYIARYALGRDYHRTVRKALLKLAGQIATHIAPHGHRVLADSAPVFEKALARDAGLGWIGKNTLLLNRQAGSWFVLGEIYTDLSLPEVPVRPPAADLCGTCTACLEACPTGALTAPYVLDARRCISAWNIEWRGPIPDDIASAMGNRLFGCDDCQLACPFTKWLNEATVTDFAPRHGLDAPRLDNLLAWSEEEWLARTEGMALRRLDYASWRRNLEIAIANTRRQPPLAGL